MAIESPKYETIQRDNRFEIREYQEYLLAEVYVEGDFGSSLQEGFRILADYIFGANTSRAHISMTVPVTQQAVSSERIEMTSPVRLSPVEEGKKYSIGFTMPSKYKLEMLPEPANKAISFRKVPGHRVAVLRFPGRLGGKLAASKARELGAWLERNHYPPKGGVTFAQYNPPWIPGVLRRNEVIVEI
jgi:hypothetical protein